MSHRWTAASPTRLDRLLQRELPDFTAGAVRALLRSGRVSLNGATLYRRRRIRPGDEVVVDLPDLTVETLPLANFDIEVCVEHDTETLLVVNKPAPLPCLPAFPGDDQTLVSALAARYPELRGVGNNRECGLLHRLDNETSGLLLIAKTDATLTHLQGQQKAGLIAKSYFALVHGKLTGSGEIDLAIAHAPGRNNRMVTANTSAEVAQLRARPATTRYRVVEQRSEHSLVEVEISRGARHQIRVHLAAIGHPIAGDTLYGPQAKRPLPRHFLHAHRLVFLTPDTEERRTIEVALPEELQKWLDG